MVKCEYCNRDRGYPCNGTRDMEDAAIEGHDDCLEQLARLGGGEKGLKYVVLNRARIRKNRADSREPLAEGREHLTVSGKFRSDKFPLPDNIVSLDLTGRCRDLIVQAAERYGGEFGRDLKDALAAQEADDATD